MAELRLGLIGCGRWGQRLAQTTEQLEGGHIAAVYDWDFEAARTFGDQLKVTAYQDYQDLIADPKIDVVLIVVPHSLHEEVCVAAAQAGKHIFCEKPLAIDVAACYRMIDAIDQAGVKLMCGQVTRLYGVYKQVAELVHSGKIGQLSSFNLNNMVHINRVNWWARSETMGALLHSPGVHMIDYLLLICGQATSVYAVESKVRVQPGVDYQDSVFLTIEFENGAIGGLECSVSCLTPGNRGHIVGTLGSLRFDPDEDSIEIEFWKGEREQIESATAGIQARTEGIRAELQSFFDWVNHGAEPILTGWEGLRAVEIIEAAYSSIALKRPVSLPLPRP